MGKMLVIGSFALMNDNFAEFRKNIQDMDIVMSKSSFPHFIENEEVEWRTVSDEALHMADSIKLKLKSEKLPIEILFSDGVSSLELILDQVCKDQLYAPIEVLYSLKKAHIHFPIKFKKHIEDLMYMRYKLRQKLGITMDQDLNAESDLLDHYPALTDMHFRETEKRRGKLKTPKMAESKAQFFGKSKNYVKSYYEHDNMHLAMAHDQDPVYLKILKDGAEVETDHEQWKKLTIQQKIWCVLEEVYVIALERKILPQMFEVNPARTSAFGMEFREWTPEEAFDWALMRVCTTLCDGFFRDFAVRAYDEIWKQYNPDYVKTFFNNIHKYEPNQEEN